MNRILLSLITVFIFQFSTGQSINENFETSPTVNTWVGDACELDSNFANPFKNQTNQSNIVFKYDDTGGTYANVRFTTVANFDLSTKNNFSFKIYVSSSEVTGSQNNQVALKLQNANLGEPWTTQTEIIKPVTLDTWQTVTFDFETDNYVNYPEGSTTNPKDRTDFNRVLIQVNGENNQDKVIAYIDDFEYDGAIEIDQPTEFNNLVWSDEFDTDGAVDNTKWHHQTFGPQGGGWFNGELQHYTDSNSNSFVSNGNLHVVAKKETVTQNGVSRDFTSARLNSKYAFTYGRLDVKAILPKDNGTWPAIWTLAKNITETGAYFQTQGFGTTPWPDCGEIDIMEHGLHAVNTVSAALHTRSSHGGTVNTKTQPLADVNNFHVYSMIWTEDSITFLIDDQQFYVYNKPAVFVDSNNDSIDDGWPFDKDQFLLLNLAVGGYSGQVDANYTESAMVIDYVRVYQEGNTASVSDINLEEKVVLYPNPVGNELTFKVPARLLGAKVTIYSVLGQKLESFTAAATQFQRNIANYTKGVYFVTFETNSGSEKYSIIKK